MGFNNYGRDRVLLVETSLDGRKIFQYVLKPNGDVVNIYFCDGVKGKTRLVTGEEADMVVGQADLPLPAPANLAKISL